MAYSRRKNRTKRTRKSRRNKRTRSYKKGGEFNTPLRNSNGAMSSSADGQHQQKQPNYSPQGNGNPMGDFNSVARSEPFVTVGDHWISSNNHITMNSR